MEFIGNHIKFNEFNEYSLISKSINGDYDSFAELLKMHKKYMYQMAYIHTRDTDISLDIIQETTFIAYKNIKSLRNPLSFKSWLTKILVNTTILELKKRKNTIYLNDYSSNNNNIIVNSSSINIEEKIDLYNAVNLLKDIYKTIVIMKYFNDLTIKDISSILNLSENTVKTNLKRAKETLYNILKEDYLNV